MATIREDSKKTWISQSTTEDINAGSLQRIADAAERQADATELMATKYRETEKQLIFYKEAYPKKNAEIERLKRSNAALRGIINRMKKQKK